MNIEKKIFQILSKTFNEKESNFTINSSFGDIKKWDSLGHIQLMLNIRKEFKIKIDPDQYETLTNVERIIKHIKVLNE